MRAVSQTKTPTLKSKAAVLGQAPQWKLMLWRFRKHRLAVAGAIVIVGLYVVVAGAEFFAYAHPQVTSSERSYIPPQRVHLFDEGRFAPFVYGVERRRDPVGEWSRSDRWPAPPSMTTPAPPAAGTCG